MKITSNYLGQLLLGIGLAILVGLFALVRDVLRHWRPWHVGGILFCAVAFWVLWWLQRQGHGGDS